ncbi:MAG: RICIN domain-containing protein [Lachnospiraceae bacterium]|nr:RICIN domain-containing protein [Lachnospiraceae bacterium]
MRKIFDKFRGIKKIITISSICLGVIIGCLSPIKSEAIMVINWDSSGKILQEEIDQIEETLGTDENEDFSIVPEHAGGSAITCYTNGRPHIRRRRRLAEQRWEFHEVKEGSYKYYIQNPSTRMVLTAASDSVSNGTKINFEKYSGKLAQQWNIKFNEDGSCSIFTALNSNYCIDVEGRKSDEGTNIHLWEKVKITNQRFFIVKEDTITPQDRWGSSITEVSQENYSQWNGSIDTSWYEEYKNDEYFVIESADALAGLAKLVNEGVSDFNTKDIKLDCNIDLHDLGWHPIGTANHPFRGAFNGCGYSIVGLTFDTSLGTNVGLFGYARQACITNLAISGHISGYRYVGGVVGRIESGVISNIYSEVEIDSTGYDTGGIAGRADKDVYIYNCTQNEKIQSYTNEACKGGITGNIYGNIRYCVNNGFITTNGHQIGGITGICENGTVEYSTNNGVVSGGNKTYRSGGICGVTRGDAIVFGCYNTGQVYGRCDEHTGGIVGRQENNSVVYCSVNIGDVSGQRKVGGIVGEGKCSLCYNAGYIQGKENVGSIAGYMTGFHYRSYALRDSAPAINGNGADNGAFKVDAASVISGKLCYDLNDGNFVFSNYNIPVKRVFYQNINADEYPMLSGSVVEYKDSKYYNSENSVKVEYDRNCGTITGYENVTSGKVALKVEPKEGYAFDHYEVVEVKSGKREMYGGNRNCVTLNVKTITKPSLVLTKSLDRNYRVKAFFVHETEVQEISDNIVTIRLECFSEGNNWYADRIPFYFVDSNGKKYYWEVNRNSFKKGDVVTRSFNIGGAEPSSLMAYPLYGDGTFEVSTKLRIDNGETYPYEIRANSLLFNAGLYGLDQDNSSDDQYIFSKTSKTAVGSSCVKFKFEGIGAASVVNVSQVGTNGNGTYYKNYKDAINKALGNNKLQVRMESGWLMNSQIKVSKALNIDLNGYSMIRSVDSISSDGGVFDIDRGGSLSIKDSRPNTKRTSKFSGGNIQGGRSNNSGGLITVDGNAKLNINGGTLYNSGSLADGGAIKCLEGNVELNNVKFIDCWTRGIASTDRDYDGGAIYMYSGKMNIRNCKFDGCFAMNNGGAIHIDNQGKVNIFNTEFDDCSVRDGDGGAINENYAFADVYIEDSNFTKCHSTNGNGGAVAQSSGELEVYYSKFDDNSAVKSGGAIFVDTHINANVRYSSFTFNSADGDGGAIAFNNRGGKLVDNFMSHNYAKGNGGAIYLGDDLVFISSCNIKDNTSSKYGGGIFCTQGQTVELEGKCFVDNNTQLDQYDGDITLDTGDGYLPAVIYVGYLEDDSHIGVNATGDINNREVVYGVKTTRTHCFFANRGKIYTKDKTKQSRIYMATAVSPFKYALYIIIILELVALFSVIIFVYRKKKKKIVVDNVNDDKKDQ